jgi:hypothetical protein
MDERTLDQKIHDSEVKWHCYMRVLAWGKSDAITKETLMWFLEQKKIGHEKLLESLRAEKAKEQS